MSDVSDVSSGAASTGAGIISSLGVGSGLNVNSIISQLMAVQDQPVLLLQNQEATAQTTVSAYGTLQSALATFQTSVASLTNLSQYQSTGATVGNTSVATATATSNAAASSYSLQVNALAQSQTLIAGGQASATSSIGTGVISFNFGTTTGTVGSNGEYASGTTFTNSGAAAATVTINSTNDSLSGIASAINSANIGVKATILNDGSNTPYRLSLSSTATGAASSMQISVSGDTALQNLLNQDPTSTTGQNMTQTSVAQNAQFTLNGLAISSSTNTNTTAISGVTLNLLSTNTTATTLTVAQNSSGAVSAVNSFVTAYNTVEQAISAATVAKTSTTAAGPLQGHNDVLSIINQMQAIIDNPVPGAPSTMNSLGQVGVTFQSDGTLAVNSATLQSALASNPNAVAGLFASNGTSTDPLINYTASSAQTQPGAYNVVISQLASQGTTVGSAAAATVITAGVNDTLQINLNGQTSNVVLAAGTYTPATLAAALQTAINSNGTFSAAGSSAGVSQSGGILTISSSLYGSTSTAAVTGGDGESSLLGASPVATTGTDVAGTIGGNAATGTGQSLVGTQGNSTGLNIFISGGSVGNRGTVNFTQGSADELNNLMTSLLSKSGAIASSVNGINATITDFGKTITADNSLNQSVLTSLQAEYSALDVTMSQLTSTSTFLTQQLSALASSSS